MPGLFVILIPILASDIVNPVLLAAVVYAFGSRRPYTNALSILMGWFVVYFASGIVLAIGLEAVTNYLKNPKPIDFGIEAVVGLLLIWVGIQAAKATDPRRKKKELDDVDSLTPISGFLAGASINLVGMPFAIPYFAVIDQILKADLPTSKGLLVLFTYNLAYVLPFAALVAIRRISGEKSDALFQKINNGMERIGSFLIPLLLILLGGALVVDAAFFFMSGKSLF
jgi:cytochrome c biogenesis protein CcdA